MSDYQTYEQMFSQVAEFIGDTSAARRAKIKSSLNRHYVRVADQFMWPSLIRGSESTLSFVSGERYLYLPKQCHTPLAFMPETIDDMAAYEWIRTMLHRGGPTFDSKGIVTSFADAGEFGRKAEPHTAAEQIKVVSSVDTDTNDVTVHGLVGEDDTYETLTLPGSAVGVTTTASMDELLSVSSDGNHTGVLTVTGVTSTTTFATIGAKERTARYRRIRLRQIPSQADKYTLYWKKRTHSLEVDDQIPEIPVSQILVEFAIADMFANQRKWGNAYMTHKQAAEQLLENKWASENSEGEQVQQAIPMMPSRPGGRRRIIVVKSGS